MQNSTVLQKKNSIRQKHIHWLSVLTWYLCGVLSTLGTAQPLSPINKIRVLKESNVQHLLKYVILTHEEKEFFEKALENVGKNVHDEVVKDTEPFR